HRAGPRGDCRLAEPRRAVPAAAGMAVAGAAWMAGLPPLLGFGAKEGAFESLLHVDAAWGGWALAAVAAGSVLTVAYSARMVWGMVGPEVPGVAPAKGKVQDPREAGWWLL